jgi:hypothetical protein
MVELTHREIVACVIALEEVHPRILGQLMPDARAAVKKFKRVS